MGAYRHTAKEPAMARMKDPKRSIVHIMPAEGWSAVFEEEEAPPRTSRIPIFAWAIVRELTGEAAYTEVTGLFIDSEGQVSEACWCRGFLRYERTIEREKCSVEPNKGT
jgi:hypothetical protein